MPFTTKTTSATNRTPHPQQQSGLLTVLPAEIRCRVWEYVLLVAPTGLTGSVRLRPRTERDLEARPSVLSLLAVCRTTHDEAAGIFYYHNKLHIGYFSLRSFVKILSLPRRDSMRKLQLSIGPENILSFQWITAACRALRHMPHISEVVIAIASLDRTTDYEEDINRELRLLKGCGLKLVAAASISLEFLPNVYRTEHHETLLRNFEKAVHAAQLSK